MRNLFIIGAQRSGSTLLAQALDLHPKINLMTPVKPEPKYFLKKNYNGKQAYIDLFKGQEKNYDYFLEKSVSYIEHDDALKRIYSDFPDARVLIILRNPVDRCLSNYRYSVENGMEKREFLEATQNLDNSDFNINISVNPFLYVERGFYDVYIKKVMNIFKNKNKNIKIIIFEEFISSSENLNNIFEWLNLEKIALASNIFLEKVNQTRSLDLDPAVLNYLAPQYIESIVRLEHLLGNKINNWRQALKKQGIEL